MAPIRNGVLCRLVKTVPNTTDTIGTVPSSDTWIIKEVGVTNGSGAAANVTVQVLNAGATVFQQIINQSVPNGTNVVVSRFLCLAPGDQVQFFASAVNVYAWVSGADLPGHL